MIIKVYTDGACSKNPGPGGCAAIGFKVGNYQDDSSNIELFEKTYSKKLTTNNEMELMGVLIALKKIDCLEYNPQKLRIEIHSDSAYVVNSVKLKWVYFWSKNNWYTKGGTLVKNVEVWKRVFEYLGKYEVVFVKVKGHSGNEMNERADVLAVAASRKAALML